MNGKDPSNGRETPGKDDNPSRRAVAELVGELLRDAERSLTAAHQCEERVAAARTRIGDDTAEAREHRRLAAQRHAVAAELYRMYLAGTTAGLAVADALAASSVGPAPGPPRSGGAVSAGGDDSGDGKPTTNATGRHAAADDAGDRSRRAVLDGSWRARVLDTMRRHPERAWRARDLADVVVRPSGTDPDAAVEPVRDALRRMLERQEVIRIDQGVYRLALPSRRRSEHP